MSQYASSSLPFDFFALDPERQRHWISERLRAPPRELLPGLSDGYRLPGREHLCVPAAVLVPVIERADRLTVLFTQRSDTLPDHPGQISFPGGRQEPEDKSAREAALREAREEIGLDVSRVTLLGELPPYETVTGYRVIPVVGWVTPPVEVTIDPKEVSEVFEVPFAHFRDACNFRLRSRLVNGLERRYYEVPYGDYYIWGATAAMLLMLHRTLFEIRPAC
jgi:8-oxo-dGTP pyrophosphatase MutT (NUDIX family)